MIIIAMSWMNIFLAKIKNYIKSLNSVMNLFAAIIKIKIRLYHKKANKKKTLIKK